MGAYLTKVGEVDEPHRTPGRELARSDLKAGRSWGSRSPFRVLADHHRAGRPADWRLYEEWLLVSKGHRTLEWSRDLRAQLLPNVEERSDEDIAAEVVEAVPMVMLAPSAWGEVVPAQSLRQKRDLAVYIAAWARPLARAAALGLRRRRAAINRSMDAAPGRVTGSSAAPPSRRAGRRG